MRTKGFWWSDIDWEDVAQTHATPAFIFHEPTLSAQVHSLLQGFGSTFSHFVASTPLI